MPENAAAARNEAETPRTGSAGGAAPSTKDTRRGLAEAPHQIAEYVRGMSRKNKILTVVAIAAILIISITVTALLNRVQYTALYSGLSAEEAGEILNVLKDDGVDAKMKGTSTVLVPEKDADDLRVSLAAKGYPKTGLSYDLFTSDSSFGATDLETRTRLQYTLQENLRTTIKNMNKIKDCIVIVNLAANSSYVVTTNTSEASAAVMLELEPGAELSNDEAVSIAKFVMKSVPKLTIDNISIVDSNMHSYDLTGDGDSSSSGTYSATQMQLAEDMKKVLSDQAMNLLKPALGAGNVAVSVNLNLDFDKETQSSVQFSPPVEGETDGMLRSLQESADNSSSGSGTTGSSGTDSNGVSGTSYVSPSGSGNASNSSSKTYNYELNELRTEIEKAQGTVSDLSVSVLINSNADGASAVADQAKDLVANAIGVDPQYITVSTLPFVESAGEKSFDQYYTESQTAAKRAVWIGIGKTALLCLTGLLAVLLVLRFLKKRKEDHEPAVQAVVEGAAEGAIPGVLQQDKEERLLADLVQTKSSETEKVEKLIEDYPEAAVQILRNWLTDD